MEQVVPCGAASVVHCNGLSSTAAAADDDDDDDDVICLDDEPVVKQSHSQHSAGYVLQRNQSANQCRHKPE